MLVENQKPEEYSFKNENDLESPIRELPAKSLTELEQFYNEMIQSDNLMRKILLKKNSCSNAAIFYDITVFTLVFK